MSLGELLEETNHVINGNKVKVVVNVKAFRDGSLGVDLNLVQSLLSQGVDLFNNEYVTGALNLLQTLGLISGGVVGLIKVINKWIAGRKITNVVQAY